MRQKQGGCFQEEAHEFKHKHKVTLKIHNQGGKHQEEISHLIFFVQDEQDEDIFYKMMCLTYC